MSSYNTVPVVSPENVFGLDTKLNKSLRDIQIENLLQKQQNYTSTKKRPMSGDIPFSTYPRMRNDTKTDRLIAEGTNLGRWCKKPYDSYWLGGGGGDGNVLNDPRYYSKSTSTRSQTFQ